MRAALRCGPGDAVLLAAIHAHAPDVPALRPHGAGLGGPWGDDEPYVVRVDPADGAAVFRDAAVVITLSHPVDATSLGPRTVRLLAGEEPAPGRLALSPDGCVVIWTPEGLLPAGVAHVLEVSGLRDRRGREVRPHRSGFAVSDHTLNDLLEEPTG